MVRAREGEDRQRTLNTKPKSEELRSCESGEGGEISDQLALLGVPAFKGSKAGIESKRNEAESVGR